MPAFLTVTLVALANGSESVGAVQDQANAWRADRRLIDLHQHIKLSPEHVHRAEYQVAPTNERLDLRLRLPERDFAWQSGFESNVQIDEPSNVWRCVLRIPLPALSSTPPEPGTRWRLNLFRCGRAHNAFLAWNPTMSGTFHVPEKFGALEFISDAPGH